MYNFYLFFFLQYYRFKRRKIFQIWHKKIYTAHSFFGEFLKNVLSPFFWKIFYEAK